MILVLGRFRILINRLRPVVELSAVSYQLLVLIADNADNIEIVFSQLYLQK